MSTKWNMSGFNPPGTMDQVETGTVYMRTRMFVTRIRFELHDYGHMMDFALERQMTTEYFMNTFSFTTTSFCAVLVYRVLCFWFRQCIRS